VCGWLLLLLLLCPGCCYLLPRTQAIDNYLPRLPSLYLEPGVRSTEGGTLATDKKTK
jgi:hypothetical protein